MMHINSSDLQHTYSDNIYNKKIVILGPVPPPLGGISVHIQRVGVKLVKQKNHVAFFDSTQVWRFYYKYLIKLIKFLTLQRPNIIYYHTLYGHGILELLSLVIFKTIFSVQFITIDHDCRYLYTKTKKFKKCLKKF